MNSELANMSGFGFDSGPSRAVVLSPSRAVGEVANPKPTLLRSAKERALKRLFYSIS